MIHICYAVSDRKGTYTKYVGASLCSLFEHTKEWVTVHFLHDHTLSVDNRRFLMQLVRSYGQQLLFHDVEKPYLARWQEAADRIKVWEEHPQGDWYPLFLGEVLTDVERVIYLEPDTIVNLDIANLWQEDVGASGLGAVEDPFKGKKYFDIGVLLLDLKIFGKQEKLLERGLDFLQEKESIDNPVSDIFNHFFGQDVFLLPNKYNSFVKFEMSEKRETVGEAIYHYAGQVYAIDAVNNYNRIFLENLAKTPWCNADFLSSLVRQIYQYNRSLMMGYANLIAGKKRIVIGADGERERLKKVLILREGEEFLTLKNFNKRGLRLEPDEILLFFIKTEEFANVKKHLESCGCKEGINFINGNVFLYRDVTQDAKILRES